MGRNNHRCRGSMRGRSGGDVCPSPSFRSPYHSLSMTMLTKAVNCSPGHREIPLSQDFFKAIKSEIWIFVIPAAMTLFILAVFLDEVGFFFRNEWRAQRWRLKLWILGTYPVFAVTSLIGLYIPRSSSLCSFMASIYHSITLWKFLGLITDFFGGKGRMLERLVGVEVSPSPFPCCCGCCCPTISVNRSNLRWMTMAVFQLSVVRTMLFFILLVLWTDEKYDYGEVDLLSPNTYMHAIIGTSTFLSFYGYLLFYKATRAHLQGYGLQGKFVCVTAVLVLFGLQSGILETMGALGVIPCTPPFSQDMRSQVIFNYAVIVEMFVICMLARYCFRKVEPVGQSAENLSWENKAVQTEEGSLYGWAWLPLAAIPVDQAKVDDSLCRIEHAPLDGFDFKAAGRSPGARGFGSGCRVPGPDGTLAVECAPHCGASQNVTLV
ncbi:organic solute transporter subunit alpha-like isoform X2 [Narcine bancroftii]|uniref:organic solute transporter subunit alpha-like isoform X2 n=1 Tax=Narcine bancroftii TaxID=1343680 RepID=UPI003831307B